MVVTEGGVRVKERERTEIDTSELHRGLIAYPTPAALSS